MPDQSWQTLYREALAESDPNVLSRRIGSMDYSFNHPVTDESQPCHYVILHSFPAPDLEARWREYLKKLDYP